jgi:hypothetical protein
VADDTFGVTPGRLTETPMFLAANLFDEPMTLMVVAGVLIGFGFVVFLAKRYKR